MFKIVSLVHYEKLILVEKFTSLIWSVRNSSLNTSSCFLTCVIVGLLPTLHFNRHSKPGFNLKFKNSLSRGGNYLDAYICTSLVRTHLTIVLGAWRRHKSTNLFWPFVLTGQWGCFLCLLLMAEWKWWNIQHLFVTEKNFHKHCIGLWGWGAGVWKVSSREIKQWESLFFDTLIFHC